MNTTQKPLLIWDGTCEFCAYWKNYWQKLTGENVSYQAYQDVREQFPEISLQQFQRSIQYIASDGKISQGAEAAFLTLSHAPGKTLWLKLYRRLPGFAFITEKAYAFIAKHRSLFYTITLWLWGLNYEPPQYNLIAWLFLRGIALIYLIAFFSFGMQAQGLIGSHGIIPTTDLIKTAYGHYGAISYWFLPMVFWINSSDWFIQASCWAGALFSLLLLFNIKPRSSLICLYLLYTSLCTAGLMFMSFQWDMFLLETGILSLFLYGWMRPTGIFLLRWLLFRFIFFAGMVKISSGDLTWLDLSALSYYFTTEPLPTPIAWYAAHLPEAVLRFGTGAALFIELFIPFLFIAPRRIRFFAGFCVLMMQTIILLTGNYNFFNLQTMLLCIVLFDDAALRKILPQRVIRFIPIGISAFKPHKLKAMAVEAFVIVTVSISIIQFYLEFCGGRYAPLVWVTNAIAPLRMVNTYGPFAVITTRRDEIIFEGSNDGENWVEYNFKYKPGDVMQPLKWNIPLQPRLDWQLWFAALGKIENNYWVLNFMQRVLENSPAVLGLLAENPFPEKPPVYLRAQYYDYMYTDKDERAKTKAVWKRSLIGTYVEPVQLRGK